MNAEQSLYKISHVFLVEADDPEGGKEQVRRYLYKNQLITYADLVIRDDEIVGAGDKRFWPAMEKGVAKNLEFADSMITILKSEGVTKLEDLVEIEEGYLTKVLHTLTHLVDGFIGVDSAFYNLVEDSHRVSPGLRTSIQTKRTGYWLVAVRTGMLEASVLHL